MTHPSKIDLDTPTPAMVRRSGEYTPAGHRAWQPSPVRAMAMRQHILERDHHTCQVCGYHHPDGYRLELDHIIPYKAGGFFVASNLQVLCQTCNVRKGARA